MNNLAEPLAPLSLQAQVSSQWNSPNYPNLLAWTGSTSLVLLSTFFLHKNNVKWDSGDLSRYEMFCLGDILTVPRQFDRFGSENKQNRASSAIF